MTNENPNKIDELFSELIDELFKPQEEAVDNVKEINRLLKKAEDSYDASNILAIVDRHIRIVELALAYQK